MPILQKYFLVYHESKGIQLLNLIFLWILLVFDNLVASDEEASGAVYLWKADEYPSLTTHAKYCTGSFRNPPTSICDPDGIINLNEARQLDKLINTEQNQTACLCEPCPDPNPRGLLIKVALVRSVDIFLNRSIDQIVENFADRTRLKWNLAKICHHDVLIMVATTYNKVVISMGNKAERVVGRKEAERIIEATHKHFTSNYVFQGLEAIIASLQHRASSYDSTLDRLGFSKSFFIWITAGLAFILLLIVSAWYCLRRESRLKGLKQEHSSKWTKSKGSKNSALNNQSYPKDEESEIFTTN